MILRKLPDEIVVYIILELDVADVLRCRTISKHINSLIQTSSVIQYKMELAANGLVPCTDTSYSAAAALHRLQEQQRAWRTCEWRAENRIELDAGCHTYELRNGVWAFGHNGAAMEPTLLGDYTTVITCYMLPSAAPPQGGDADGMRRWTLANLGLVIRDFTMDPLLDLLVLVEQTPVQFVACPFRIHIRRLSDGEPHEMAVKHALDFVMVSSSPETCAFGVQLYGPHVGVVVRQADADLGNFDYMGVWNWRTGAQEMYKEADNSSFDDFAFIDTWTIMLAVIRNAVALEIWRFDSPHKQREKPLASYVGGFSLPLTTADNAYLDVHFDGSPSLSLAGAKTVDGTPFTPIPEPHMLTISFGVIDPGHIEVAWFTMVMRLSLMLKMLEGQSGTELEWSAWGPECTRWMPQDRETFKWEPCAFGGRYAVVGPRERLEVQPSEPAPQVIRLFDFRPGAIARRKDELEDGLVCVCSSTVQKGTMFVYDIVSTLPYHVATSAEISTQVSGVMIDEGRLVCTKLEFDDDDWRTLLVLSF